MTILSLRWCTLSLAAVSMIAWAPNAGAQGYRELAAVPWQGTGVDLFAIDSDESVEHRFQREPTGDFAGFEELGGIASDIAAVELADGRYEVFIVDREEKLWRTWQPPGGWDWTDWELLDDATKKISVVRSNSGRVELFEIGSDDALWHIGRESDQEALGYWNKLELSGTQLSAAAAQGDGFELAVTDSEGALWLLSFSASAEPVGEPQNLGGESFDVALARLPDGGHNIVAVGTENRLYERRRPSLEQGWTEWQSLERSAQRVTLVEASIGLQLFALTDNGSVLTSQLTAADAAWSEPQILVEASPLDSELQGSARLIIPSLNVDQAVPVTIGLRFSVDRSRVALTSFPDVVTERFDTPLGATTSTIHLRSSGSGELQRADGVLRLPITLHFDQSLDLPFFDEDGSLSLDLSSDHPDGRLLDLTSGDVALSASGEFVGDGSANPLAGQNCQLVVSGVITPVP